MTEKSLSDVDFSVENIKNIISKLDSSKAYGDDMVSIRMLKLYDKSICKPLSITFKSCLTQGVFPSEWKKTNVVPIYKKNDKRCVTNDRPVCLSSPNLLQNITIYYLEHEVHLFYRKQLNIRKPIRF